MESEKIFKTKSGFCHILPDKIVLTRDGIIGNISKVMAGKTSYKIPLIYSGLSAFLLYSAYNEFQNGQTFKSLLFGVIGLYLIYEIVASLNKSATPVIERSKIRSVKFKKAIKSLTRSRFEVVFENDKGNVRKQLILLPGSLTDGANETEKAIRIMSEENLI